MLTTVLGLMAVQGSMWAQNVAPPEGTPEVRVCCRPLPKWSASKNPLLIALNRTIVRHLHHCYIDMGDAGVLPEVGGAVQTSGIHPIRSDNDNKQPIPDQITDTLVSGGECRKVDGATPEKIDRLRDELAGETCNSCASHYHNRVLSLCYNNSNTYVYDLISGAGMTPPKMRGAPGYRPHHACVRNEKRGAR